MVCRNTERQGKHLGTGEGRLLERSLSRKEAGETRAWDFMDRMGRRKCYNPKCMRRSRDFWRAELVPGRC